ncbi:hypothetical protein BTUL_0173g00010 [Botrytis tulipae]|uniref:Uncharacterized protein n=1 Tax=Botrytis tulipae TaxID=87230 RepID=A0A4Z1EFH3_9HELO|nr:hypothetical protein BTUL_0173g00010 [Botrytis tulipae]
MSVNLIKPKLNFITLKVSGNSSKHQPTKIEDSSHQTDNMSTTTILASFLHSIENFLAYLFTPLNTHLSSTVQQFLIISSACFTGILIFSFLNKAVNIFGALLTRIPINPETLLNQAIGEIEAIPTSAETLLSQAFCKFDAVRNHNTIKKEKDVQDCKTVLRNKKAGWQTTAKQTKYTLMALYGWIRKGIMVLSGLSLVNVGVLSLLGGARGEGLTMLGISLPLLLVIGRGLVH